MAIKFTVTKVSSMPTANIKGTLPAGSPPVGGSSIVTVVETTADGTIMAPAGYSLTSPTNTFTFTAGVGSTLNASQVDVSAGGIASPPTITPPFLIVNPAPPAPGGPITFEVMGINP